MGCSCSKAKSKIKAERVKNPIAKILHKKQNISNERSNSSNKIEIDKFVIKSTLESDIQQNKHIDPEEELDKDWSVLGNYQHSIEDENSFEQYAKMKPRPQEYIDPLHCDPRFNLNKHKTVQNFDSTKKRKKIKLPKLSKNFIFGRYTGNSDLSSYSDSSLHENDLQVGKRSEVQNCDSVYRRKKKILSTIFNENGFEKNIKRKNATSKYRRKKKILTSMFNEENYQKNMIQMKANKTENHPGSLTSKNESELNQELKRKVISHKSHNLKKWKPRRKGSSSVPRLPPLFNKNVRSRFKVDLLSKLSIGKSCITPHANLSMRERALGQGSGFGQWVDRAVLKR